MSNIFLITPSYLIEKKRDFNGGLKQLQNLGFNILNPEWPERMPSPQEKAAQIHKALQDSAVDILLAQRGGYSAMKALPYLDFDLIQQHPKIIAGFSDLSALLNPIFERTGLTTLHSPMVLNLAGATPFTLKSFMNALNGFPQPNLLRGAKIKVYNPGQATGILKGGNLITLTALIDTDWEIDTDGAILFLEDVDELQHEVDRYLTQWILAGKFKGVKAILLGDFRGLHSQQVFEILASQMTIDMPVLHCPCIGHVPNKITLPVGAGVALDTSKKELVITGLNLPGGSA